MDYKEAEIVNLACDDFEIETDGSGCFTAPLDENDEEVYLFRSDWSYEQFLTALPQGSTISRAEYDKLNRLMAETNARYLERCIALEDKVGYYDYADLGAAVRENPTQKNLHAFGHWLCAYGKDYWDGECWDVSFLWWRKPRGYRVVIPVYKPFMECDGLYIDYYEIKEGKK